MCTLLYAIRFSANAVAVEKEEMMLSQSPYHIELADDELPILRKRSRTHTGGHGTGMGISTASLAA